MSVEYDYMLNKLKEDDAGASQTAGHIIQDESVSKPQQPNMNFIGDGVLVTDNAGNNSTDVTISLPSAVLPAYIDQSGGVNDTYGVLAGTINGVNTTFTTSQSVYDTGSLQVFLNGQLQTQGDSEDWQETTPASGTFDFTVAPIVGDEIVVKYNDNGAVLPTVSDGIKYINSLNDFPAAITGQITLEDNIRYIGVGREITFSLTDDLVFGQGASIEHLNITTTKPLIFDNDNNDIKDSIVTYTGVGDAIQGTFGAGVFRILRSSIVCASGTFFNLSFSSGGLFILDNIALIGAGTIGSVTGAVTSIESITINGWGGGLNIIDGLGTGIKTMQVLNGANNVGNFLTFSGTSQGGITIDTYAATMGTNEKAYNFTPTTTFDGVRAVEGSVNDKTRVFSATSLDYSDKEILFNNNTNIPSSTVKCNSKLINNAAQTSIPAINSWVIINATTWFESPLTTCERITLGTDGVSEYIGLEDVGLLLDGNITPSPVTSTKNIATSFLNIHAHTKYTVTFTNGTNTINEVGTALNDGDTISFYGTAGTLPTGLRKDVVYFVINKATNSFQVSYTSGGTAVAFTDDGTPINSYSRADITGSDPQNLIASTAPRDLVPQSLIDVVTGDKIAVILQNKDDSVTLNCAKAYYRTTKSS